jgi:hypothetical protein
MLRTFFIHDDLFVRSHICHKFNDVHLHYGIFCHFMSCDLWPVYVLALDLDRLVSDSKSAQVHFEVLTNFIVLRKHQV